MSGCGFEPAEFRARLQRAQALMAARGLEALLLTREPEIRYFTGFLTRFFESPTRPWFVVLPASGKPVAVIPTIGAALMAQSWVEDIRTWQAPDPRDDGVTLLAATLAELTGPDARIGTPDGHETSLRMPIADFERLKGLLGGTRRIAGDGGIVRELRMVKSAAEVTKIEQACAIAARAFARVPEIAAAGVALDALFRRFQILCLEEGADEVRYLAGGAGPLGYADVISPAGTRTLERGDVVMLDSGVVRDGYFCDFDRNWSIGPADPRVRQAHARLVEAADAAFEMARPGTTAADLFLAMDRVLARGGSTGAVGRLGHGVGMALTEWPSLTRDDHTRLEAGMVLAVEPCSNCEGLVLVHEEMLLITEGAPRYLTPRLGPELVAL